MDKGLFVSLTVIKLLVKENGCELDRLALTDIEAALPVANIPLEQLGRMAAQRWPW